MSVASQLRGWGKEIVHRVQKRVALRNFENQTPTLVYQMGKVGSSTVVETLENLPLLSPIVRVHSLHPAKVSEDIETLRESLGYLREHVITSSTLVQKQLDWGEFPCTVITLTREPVGRAISFAFQDWRRQLPEVSVVRDLDPEKMIELVMQKLRPGSLHADPGRWFERELKSVFGIDVMTVPYDFDQGYVKIQAGPVDVLVMRMEDLDRSLKGGLRELYGLSSRGIEVERSNVGKKKAYADLLADVKARLSLPRPVSKRVWSTDYARHFYGPDLSRLRDKWEKSP
jgi:hypothetical protein